MTASISLRYMDCRVADFIGLLNFLEIFLEMLFWIAFGTPEKSVPQGFPAFLRPMCLQISSLLY